MPSSGQRGAATIQAVAVISVMVALAGCAAPGDELAALSWTAPPTDVAPGPRPARTTMDGEQLVGDLSLVDRVFDAADRRDVPALLAWCAPCRTDPDRARDLEVLLRSPGTTEQLRTVLRTRPGGDRGGYVYPSFAVGGPLSSEYQLADCDLLAVARPDPEAPAVGYTGMTTGFTVAIGGDVTEWRGVGRHGDPP